MAHDLATQAPRGAIAQDGLATSARVFPAGTEPATVKGAALDIANPNLALPEPHGP